MIIGDIIRGERIVRGVPEINTTEVVTNGIAGKGIVAGM